MLILLSSSAWPITFRRTVDLTFSFSQVWFLPSAAAGKF